MQIKRGRRIDGKIGRSVTVRGLLGKETGEKILTCSLKQSGGNKEYYHLSEG